MLQQKARDKGFLSRYQQVYEAFQEYMNDRSAPGLCQSKAVNSEKPVAYFSMEYGFHEALPIYSGGLGILSGDHEISLRS